STIGSGNGVLLKDFGFFLWLLARDRLLTNKEISMRGMTLFPFCERCGREEHLQAPYTKWVKINVDGSVLMSKLRAAIRGVIRGPIGGWMVGFKMVTDIFQIEALAMLEGLKLTWSWGFQKLEIESDNALLIDTLCNGSTTVSNIAEVRMIHEWFYKDW
ncbi:hypothetical protein Goari_003100, partial [Gossypium aridum]|nr:hypothetical protein [Gossypium aridum]